MEREDRDFLDAVRGLPNRIRCPYAEALKTHRVALAISQSVASRRPVAIERDRNGGAPCLNPNHPLARDRGAGQAYFFSYEEGPPSRRAGSARRALQRLFGRHGTDFPEGHQSLFAFALGCGARRVCRRRTERAFPVPFLGYMEVGRVAESRADGFTPGDIVASTYGHKSGHTADPFHELLVPIPDDIDPILGIFVAQMGPIAANGILHADAEVFGAGVRRLGEGIAGPSGRRVRRRHGRAAHRAVCARRRRRGRARRALRLAPRQGRALGLTAMTEDEAWQHAKAPGTMWPRSRRRLRVSDPRPVGKPARMRCARCGRRAPSSTSPSTRGARRDPPRRGVPPQRPGHPLRADRPRAARIGASMGPPPACGGDAGAARTQGEAIRREMITHVVPIDEAPASCPTSSTSGPNSCRSYSAST